MVSIIILNWNGVEFLERCVSSVEEAVSLYKNECEIIVVDNASSDGSLEYLQRDFPKVRVVALSENFGFAKGMNTGVKRALGDIVIGLNNDTIVSRDFIGPLISHFLKEKELFAVAAKMLLWDKKTLNFGRAVGNFKFGVFRRSFEEPLAACSALYACGGAFAADRKKFIELGGFDEDMISFWEDLDICYRAWKKGYKTIYEPGSLVYHKLHGSFEKKCGQNGVRLISGENYFLFVIKNIHDRWLVAKHLLSLPLLMFVSVVLFKPHFALGLIRSARRWPVFLEKRRQERSQSRFCDREVLAMSGRR